MPEFFDVLPGQEVPVGGISAGFKKLWADTPAKEGRAVQLNLVLHLGRRASAADALVQFQHLLNFARRYPARVVVLCPDYDEGRPVEIRAKIYGECFFGKAQADTRCVEFVILHYTMAARAHLESQVSVCLSTDLPLYYWAHAFAESRRIADYDYLLTRSARVLFDSAIVPADAFTFPWPNLSAVRDLAYTRTLPLRQNLGQFLSRYAPADIAAGLQTVTLRHQAEFAAEASCLLGWIKKGLVRGGSDLAPVSFTVKPEKCQGCFELSFGYADTKKIFLWQADLSKNQAVFTGDLGHGRTTLTVGAHLLTPELALAEAMFF
ncbi:Glucose-6-phosphate dehydrogenase subunit [Lacunisphaera limnophila]|uniref:Glucose-6-phosphate dehydrogenase subunit n=1 Tax=Lacunisphaera limnophila TaxID=1838286 RepID=A0A1D8AZ77_9BACT|nr:glucose-6-phosphate dehydrogenase assembly protein OpcA [Lacunisphaera limnophila]AOS46202.1 Glucose-6-phosphate dehydrogenase subunit [Lacunisphaera limnophila]